MDNNRNRPDGNNYDWDAWKEYYQSSSSHGRNGNSRQNDAEMRKTEKNRDKRDIPEKGHSQRVKNGRGKKKKKPISEKKKAVRRNILIVLISCIFVGIVVGSGVIIGMYAAVRQEISDMNIKNLALNYSSFIYYQDENGAEQELQQINSASNRVWVDSDQIADVAKEAVVSIEDQRFYSHKGVDIKRTIGATVKWGLSKIGIGNSSYGGSTITQQVVKNITSEKDKKATRKIKEILRAVALEREMSKDEILTMYLNIVYFANGCYGIEAAAEKYYDVSAAELTLPQAAAIVGITQTPSKYDPFAHPENTIEKRNLILSKMLELDKIDQTEYNNAVSSDLGVKKSNANSGNKMTSYFVDQLINDVSNDLQEQKGYSSSFAMQQIQNGGLKIYATINPSVQEKMEEVFTDTSNFPKVSGKDAQASMIIIDPKTGGIKGLIGGLGEKTDVQGWNRATQMKRQPGSAIKPLAVYAPALEEGINDSKEKFTEATILNDTERTFITSDKKEWTPKNSYSGYKGNMTAKEAVEISANIPSASVLEDYLGGSGISFRYMQTNFHFSSLADADNDYSPMSLGGLTNGVSPKEMAAAYAAFANDGKYTGAYTYTRVEDSYGKVILENKPVSTQALKPSTAYIISDMLSEVVNGDNGTGTGAKISGQNVYGKTGTTNDDYDKWFVGYTPYYVGAAWYGFDTPSSIKEAGVSGNPAVKAWKLVMEKVHEDLEEKELSKPSNVTSASICTSTGKLAKSRCPDTVMYFDTNSSAPSGYCSKHGGSSEKSEDDDDEPSSGTKTTKKPSSNKNKPEATVKATSTPKAQSPKDDEEDKKPVETKRPQNDEKPSNEGDTPKKEDVTEATKIPVKTEEE